MGCCFSKAGDEVVLMRSKGKPQWVPPVRPNPTNPIATCKTSAGTFTVELFLDQVPITASNFVGLARSKFYDGQHFHRCIPGFMAQFGCPRSRDLTGASGRPGGGGPPIGSTFENLKDGTTVTRTEHKGKGVIPDERVARISNVPGTLAMANTGPNSGGSQFFINVRRSTSLDWFSPGPSKHVVFGQVIEGYSVVEAITEMPTRERDMPEVPICMSSVTVSVRSPFGVFLRSKGADLWADHEDFASMPQDKQDEIMSAFADVGALRVTTDRSLPHRWSFSAGDVLIEWTPPPRPDESPT
jgi:cyclophilin family peptidyl-prolyl cis-trans isomerase